MQILAGIRNVIDHIMLLLNGMTNFFTGVDFDAIWKDFVPLDLRGVMQLLVAVLLALTVIGLVKKVVLIFG